MWYENGHISLVAIATCELFIFIHLDENSSRIYRKINRISSTYYAIIKQMYMNTFLILDMYTLSKFLYLEVHKW